ncbi:sodium:calcium antiporter [Candidatus Parcubacteria bacterium]|uniref:Sodium/calcium exchanger membrane region domain-containing protein n=1 Tax=Candidatus Kaiserbacteria bacterium CG10_big_fil_rev_8_21_14_0_10_47_16 TaxID=1974608 RepID=A0A2H0UD42_9BACT|nr:sodium:calcium antiporter [Candidatus Parcubacteria bacterium]PIR84344.1 MAG: hypothetical protein COU16_01995 [Candidatus Kaiserbacteria bacterium CG10_big_fil_rev_8_21_14_0_10_47_16]
MDAIVHVVLFLTSLAVIWYFSGSLIETVNQIARHINKSGFVVAFFILGFFTSISEISVAVNASLEGVPQVSVGNLVGASFVILLLIVPLLAVASGKIELKNTLTDRNLILALLVSVLPVLFVIDGSVTRQEGFLLLAAYVTLLFAIRNQPQIQDVEIEIPEPETTSRLWFYITKTVIGAVVIFFAGHILVTESVYFATALSVPQSIIGLVLLSIGTNVPEIMVAVQALRKKQKAIAFGNYLGSAVTNTPIFAFLVLANGTFTIASEQFLVTAILMCFGFVLLAIFVRSKCTLSRREGIVLFSFYVLFILAQTISIAAIVGQ